MRELKNTEMATVSGGGQSNSNPPPGSEGNLSDAWAHGVATLRETGSGGRALQVFFVRAVT